MSPSHKKSQGVFRRFKLTTSLLTVLIASAGALQPPVWDSGADTSTGRSSMPSARMADQISLRADSQGSPLISLGEGREVIASYTGESRLVQELESDGARPLSLASADFDEDGVPDLASGYAGASGGIVVLYRGNLDSIYPNAPEARDRKATGAFTSSPFLGPARVFAVNERADFIQTGDFDGDSHQDIVACRKGGESIYLLPGDGRGGFGQAREISLPGKVTAVCSGDINRRDGLTDLVVAIASDEGARALVFEGPNGALRAPPEEFLLPAEATSMAIGQLDDQYTVDLVIACGRELVFIYGRDRKLSLDKREQAGVSRASIARRGFPSFISSVAIGNFEGDYRNDIAVLTGDGTIQTLRGSSKERWPIGSLSSKPAVGLAYKAASAKLIPARLSTGAFDDLIAVDEGSNQLRVIASARAVAIDADSEPVAVLPMRLDVDALNDLVVLRAGSAKPAVAMTARLNETRSQALAPFVTTFSNTTPISIPTAFSPPAAATPYPSTISVSGLSGPVDKVRVRLMDINITAHVVDILLVGPGGQNVLLMSDAGGPSVMSNTTLVFDDDAGAFIPALGVPSGTYRPTNNDNEDTFPGPAPAGPYSEVLSVFDGTDPNGVWSLYAVNDTFLSPGGNVNGGWSLIFGQDPPPTPLVVTNTNDSGPGSFRQALLDSNMNLGADIIHFDIGSGAQTITPLSSLPDILDVVTIDATTQPGFAGSPLIELDMSSVGSFSVGLTLLAGNSSVRGLVINRFGNSGIRIRNGSNNIIEGNFIGTDLSGAADLGNPLTDGIEIDTADNLIGGTTQPARNLISGVAHGIIFSTFNSDPATDNLIHGNFIGTNASGTGAIGNSHAGISTNSAPGSPGNFIGGATAGAGNLISGNGTGVDLSNSASIGNLVQGNLIGLDVAGSSPIANVTGLQVGLSAHDNTVGGTIASTRNAISGNVFHGVVIRDQSSTGNLVQGNFIGTDVSGKASAGNGTAGVFLLFSAADNTIGGMSEGAGNLISGNGFGSGAGIDVGQIDRPVTTSNDIQGNLIGTDLTGTAPLANNGDGIRVPANADGNRIENNTISFNTGAGICIPNVDVPNNTPGIRISIKDNSIYSNTTLGIDLGPTGVTANDPEDLDVGPNSLQNFPVLTSATFSNGMLHIVGSLHSTPNTDFFVQFFSSSQCMGSNPGQDQQVLNFLPLLFHTDASGNAPIDVTLNITPAGGWVNCLATDATGNTSEFSPCAPINCNFSIMPQGQAFGAGGGANSVSVTAGTGCNWTAVSNDSFINITSGSGGSGNGTVNYTVGQNTGVSGRSGTMTIAGQTFTVDQEGMQCAFSIAPQSQNFSSAGGADSVAVTAPAGCDWTAMSNDSFINITSGQMGSGNGTVNYTVMANAGPARIGTMTIAGETFTVNQTAGCVFSLDRTSQSFAANGGVGTINVTTLIDCDWTATSNDPWIEITAGDAGTGSGQVQYSVSSHPSTSMREGAITVAGMSFNVLQGAAFADVALNHPFYTEIGKLSARRVTLGCDATNYCPDLTVTRQQMAAFIIRALGDFNPPPPAMQRFQDVPPSNPFYAFIEQMAVRQITLGCAANMYCPTDPVLRDQMAAFIIRALHEPGYIPPQPAMQRFADVAPSNAFYAHIEEMAVRQITLGCGGGNYCPSLEVSRGQMAAFLVRAFNL